MEKFDIKNFSPGREGLEYYESKPSFEEAWNDCERGDWMLCIADKLGVDDRTLTRAKALCANTVRDLMKDKCSTDAIDAALRYADGEISREELNEYTIVAHYAYVAVHYDSVSANYAAKKDNRLATADICREVLTKAVFDKIKG